jgi:hypothetical protein
MRRAWVLVFLLVAFLLVPATPARGDHVADEDIIEALPPDIIPAIREPVFAERDYLASFDRVIGVEIDGDARAYPVRVLNWHEVVNDVVAGVPIAVTFCPLCGTGVVFDRRVDNATLVFGVSGKLYRANLLMFDELTGSLWAQALGEAIQGPYHGTRLRLVTATLAEWETWKQAHPNTRLLARPFPDCSEAPPPGTDPIVIGNCKDYSYNPYTLYLQLADVPEIFGANYTDTVLPPKAMVLGVEVNGAFVAYPYDTLANESVVNDRVNGVNLLVTFVNNTARAYLRGDRTFAPAGGILMVDGAGATWNMLTGASVAERLSPAKYMPSLWFAWAQFHPETGVYGIRDPVLPSSSGTAYVVLAGVSVGLVAAAVAWRRFRK